MAVKSDPAKDDLLSPDRVDIHRLMSLIPILPYHHVADIGCGPGYFTVPLAKFLFHGKVFALDVQQEMLDAAREAVDAVRLTNVEAVLSEEKKLPLEDGSLDGALMAFVLQEASSARALLKEALRCLKASGWLAVLAWDKREMDEGPPLKQRIAEDAMLAMAEKVGLRFTARRDLSDRQYMLMLRK